jgi:hypothetical protein
VFFTCGTAGLANGRNDQKSRCSAVGCLRTGAASGLGSGQNAPDFHPLDQRVDLGVGGASRASLGIAILACVWRTAWIKRLASGYAGHDHLARVAAFHQPLARIDAQARVLAVGVAFFAAVDEQRPHASLEHSRPADPATPLSKPAPAPRARPARPEAEIRALEVFAAACNGGSRRAATALRQAENLSLEFRSQHGTAIDAARDPADVCLCRRSGTGAGSGSRAGRQEARCAPRA